MAKHPCQNFMSLFEEKRKPSSFHLGSSLEKGTSLNKSYITEKGVDNVFLRRRRGEGKNYKKHILASVLFLFAILLTGTLYYYHISEQPENAVIKIENTLHSRDSITDPDAIICKSSASKDMEKDENMENVVPEKDEKMETLPDPILTPESPDISPNTIDPPNANHA